MERLRRSLNIKRGGVQPTTNASGIARTTTKGMAPVAEDGATMVRLGSTESMAGMATRESNRPQRFTSGKRPSCIDARRARVRRRALTELERNMIDAAATGNLEVLTELLEPKGETARPGAQGARQELCVDVDVQEWSPAQIKAQETDAICAAGLQNEELQGGERPAANGSGSHIAMETPSKPPFEKKTYSKRIISAFRESHKIQRKSRRRRMQDVQDVDNELIVFKLMPGQTALHKAVRFGHVEAAQLLLEAGADTRVRDAAGREPWYYAAFSASAPQGTHAPLTRLLYRYERHPTADLLLLAAFSSRPGVLEVMLDHLQRDIVSRSSSDRCTIRFHDLHLLDDARHQIQWPDNSMSAPGITPFVEVVRRTRTEPLCKRLLTHPSMMALLSCKWNANGRRVFIIEFVLYLCMVASLSTAVGIRSYDIGSFEDDRRMHQIIFTFEVICVTAAILLLPSAVLHPGGKITCRRLLTTYSGHRLVCIVLSLAGVVMCWNGLYKDDSPWVRYTFGIFAFLQVMLWAGLVPLVALMSRRIGILFITVEQVLKKDLLVWASVLVIFLPSLALSLALLAKSSGHTPGSNNGEAHVMDNPEADYANWSHAVFSLWLTMFGLMDWNRANDASATQVMVTFVTLLLNVLALNLLIAMVNATYQATLANAQHEWIARRALYVVEGCKWGGQLTRYLRDEPTPNEPFLWHGWYSEMYINQPQTRQHEVLGMHDTRREDAVAAKISHAEELQLQRIERAVQAAIAPLQKRLPQIEERLAAIECGLRNTSLACSPGADPKVASV